MNEYLITFFVHRNFSALRQIFHSGHPIDYYALFPLLFLRCHPLTHTPTPQSGIPTPKRLQDAERATQQGEFVVLVVIL